MFSNPYDTKTWLRLIHRGLRFNGNDKSITDNTCKLCHLTRESHAHLLTCSKINKLRRLVFKLFRATGFDFDSFVFPNTWLTCLDANNNPLNHVQSAFITIHWNVVYKDMTKQKLENKPFNNTAVKKEYCRMIAHII